MADVPLLTGPVDLGSIREQLNTLIVEFNALAAQGLAPPLVQNGNTIGAENGVSVQIQAGAVSSAGTTGYYYGPTLYVFGGDATGGAYAYGGLLKLQGGNAGSGAIGNYGGDVSISGGSGYTRGGRVSITGDRITLSAFGAVDIGTLNGINLNGGTAGIVPTLGTAAGPSGSMYLSADTTGTAGFVRISP